MAEEAPEASRNFIVVDKYPDVFFAVITLNRPKSLNSLTRSMMRELAQAFKALGQDSAVRAIILTGNGRAFCAGVDLTAAQEVFKGDVKDVETDVVYQMEHCRVPILGAINGHAITAGFEIALACDILIASTNATFVDTHSKFGIFPSWGLSQKLPRLIGPNRAKEASLTAAPITAATADKWGLVNRVFKPEELLPAAKELAVAIANNKEDLVQRYKSVINDGLELPLGEGRKLERERAHDYYTNVMTSEDFAAMKKFIGGRSSKLSGVQQAMSKL